jgi:hypothetical protein
MKKLSRILLFAAAAGLLSFAVTGCKSAEKDADHPHSEHPAKAAEHPKAEHPKK